MLCTFPHLYLIPIHVNSFFYYFQYYFICLCLILNSCTEHLEAKPFSPWGSIKNSDSDFFRKKKKRMFHHMCKCLPSLWRMKIKYQHIKMALFFVKQLQGSMVNFFFRAGKCSNRPCIQQRKKKKRPSNIFFILLLKINFIAATQNYYPEVKEGVS